jgi:exodeoxyribonuclease V beta subunit
MEVFDIFKTEFKNKTTLIEASAGTGKTYTITSLVLRLLLKKEISIDQILVVTFTEAAASELKDRILKRLKDALKGFQKKIISKEDEIEDPFIRQVVKDYDEKKGKDLITKALRSFDLAPVYTIHGFCYRILSENAFETKNFFDSEIITDENILIQQSADDFYRKYISKASKQEAMIIHSNKLYPEYIAGLAKQYLKYENPEIVAYEPDTDISELINRFFEFKTKLGKIWTENKNDIIALFKDKDVMNQKKYKFEQMEKRSDYLDELFSNRFSLPAVYTDEKINKAKNPFFYFMRSEIEKGVKSGKNAPEHIFFEKCESFYFYALNLEEETDKFISFFKKKAIHETGENLKQIKEQYRLLGFNDFLTKVKQGLDKDKSGLLVNILKKRYKAALIDEFQDTDSLQYEIFKTAFKNKVPLFFIGDPKQSIYRFRGADLFAYLKAKSDADYVYTMNKNYRSSPGIVKSVNSIFTVSENPFVYKEVGYQNIVPAKDESEAIIKDNKKSPSMELICIGGETGKNYGESDKFLIKYICSEISYLLNKGENKECYLKDKPVSPEDIAVLVRSNDQGRQIRKALEDNLVPAVLTSEESVFDSEEALAVLEFLDSVYNSADERKIRGVLTGNLFLKKTSELNKLKKDEDKWSQIVQNFRDFNSVWTEKGVMEVLTILFYDHNILKIQSSLGSGERRVTNLLHLFEILHEEEVKNRRGRKSLIKWLADNIYNRTSSSPEYELRLESDKNKVKILTVHKSKGLEFSIVFCGFIQREAVKSFSSVKETMYHRQEDNKLVIDFSPQSDQKALELMEKELLSEDLRLFYVALTRAKYKTYFFMNESQKQNCVRSPDFILKHDFEDDTKKLMSFLESFSGKEIKTRYFDSDEDFNFYQFHPVKENQEFTRCSFTKNLYTNFKILSFSSLASLKGGDVEKLDAETKNYEPDLKEDPFSSGIMGFPKGAFAGLFFHSVFEDLCFSADDEKINELIKLKLENFNYDLQWQPHVFKMVENVLNKNLGYGFSLSDLKEEKKITELEFYYPLQEKEINLFFNNLINSDINPQFKKKLKKVTPGDAKGFMKGFIDLVFEHEGRFYILDWKSNHLGYLFEDYNIQNLEHEIAETLYFLQYYIYTAALDKYLSYRLGNKYSYEKNFGGIFYLFLRGIDEGNNINGIYYDLPQII